MITIGSLQAPDTKQRPWYGSEASWTNRCFAFVTVSKAIAVNAPQRGSNRAQQAGLAAQVANLDCDVAWSSQYLEQLSLFFFEELLESRRFATCCGHGQIVSCKTGPKAKKPT